MNKKVLVTGATGFIGNYTVRHLLASGYKVSILVRPESLAQVSSDPFRPEVRIFEGDLLDPDSLEAAFQDQDAVVHAAALVSFRPEDKTRLTRINVEGTANVVNTCLDQHISHLVHISSIAALGGQPGQEWFDETAIWVKNKRHTPYAETKYQAELEVWRGKAEGLNVSILNPSLVIGPWLPGHHSMKIFSHNLPFYPSGGNGLVDVRDVVEAVRSCLDLKVYDERIILNGHNLSYKEMLDRLAMHKGKKGPPIALPRSLAMAAGQGIGLLNRILRRNTVFQPRLLHSVFSKAGFDNTKSIDLLGLKYRPVDESIIAVLQGLTVKG